MAGEFVERSRHGTIFYFRRRVPSDIRDRLGKRHIYVTLRTQERRTALRRARLLAVHTDQLFEEIRKMPGDKDPKYADTYLNWHIDFDERSRPKKVSFTEVNSAEDEARALRIASEFAKLPAAPVTPKRPTPTIAEAIGDLVRSGEVAPRSLKEYARMLAKLAEFFGAETTLGSIDQDRYAEYADQINAHPNWSGKTKNSYIVTGARLFNRYAGRNSAVPSITTKGLQSKRARPAGHDRDAFTVDEIRAILENAWTYRTKKPCKWWISVATAFLGCRVEELAQAHLAGDFVRDSDTGCMVLRINEDPADPHGTKKSVKTLAGWRSVPVHPILERAGFVAFLERQRELGYSTPFASQWTPYHDKKTGAVIHNHGAVKWAANELKKLRKAGLIDANAKLGYFHSLRHAFITLLDKAGVNEEWRAGIAGQAYGGVNSQVYSKAREDVSQTLPRIVAGLQPLEAVLSDLLARDGGEVGRAP